MPRTYCGLGAFDVFSRIRVLKISGVLSRPFSRQETYIG